MDATKRALSTTTDGQPPAPELVDAAAPQPVDPVTGQHRAYWVLSEAERAKGFMRPVRHSYVHAKCGTATTMSRDLAETYAREPAYYGSTFCVRCRGHFPVGADGEFVWEGTEEKVGT